MFQIPNPEMIQAPIETPDDELLDIFGFWDILFIIILIILFVWQFFF